MKKTLTGLLFLSLLLLSPRLTLAADTSGLTDNGGASASTFYPATFDNVALDFNLQHKSGDSGVPDTLTTLTVKNNGTARNSFEFTAVKLWTDGYQAGWQGWGYDNLVATAKFDGSGLWYFTDLRLDIPAAGLRLFVTVDTNNSLAARKSVQFYIPQLLDSNSNGSFDLGDAGIFTASGVNGPALDFMNGTPQILVTNNNDIFPPQAIIINLTNGQTLAGLTSFTVNGLSRDQGRGSVNWVKIGLGADVNHLTWSAVTPGANLDYSAWQYQWQNIIPGTYVLVTQAADVNGNISLVSNPLTVTITAPVPVTPPADNSAPVLPDGALIKGTDSKVYVLSNGQKLWISSGEVFVGLGYRWDKIQTVADSELNRYPDGADLTVTYRHPAGTLIKYQTYAEVYLINSIGQRQHIANEATFLGSGYHWDDIITIPDWEYYPDGTEIRS